MNKFKRIIKYVLSFFKWILFGSFIGLTGGVIGSLFHICVDKVTELRIDNGFLVYFLPLGSLLIVFLYKLFEKSGRIDTNRVMESIRSDKDIPFIMVPLIFLGTVITHLVGGSAGREGAALQIGGGIGYNIGRIFRLNHKDMHIVVMSGMSAVFAALFGTPVTAAFFAIEVIKVGKINYAGLVPCLISSVIAFEISNLFGVVPVRFNLAIHDMSSDILLKTIIIAVACALVSILFCLAIKYTETGMKKLFKNSYVRALAGACIILLLSVVFSSGDYNGAGMNVISNAISGVSKPEAFLVKIVFTAITIAAGFKGGEIVPAFFVGSTLGCTLAGIIGLNPSLGASIGFIALFCGVVNCPVASLLLAVEVFGSDMLIVFAVVCAVSYMMSGRYSLYESQKIYYSKYEDAKN